MRRWAARISGMMLDTLESVFKIYGLDFFFSVSTSGDHLHHSNEPNRQGARRS